VLGAELEDDTDPDDDVLEICVVERLAFPLVLLGLTLPEFSGQLRRAVLPASANAHALVELDTHF